MLNFLYKLLIDDVTHICYGNSLEFFPDNSRILDVGIGNGIMMKEYHEQIKSKHLKITGIDINERYLVHCRKMIRRFDLEDLIDIQCIPVERYRPPEKGYFDYILFSMSFMLLDDQQLVLDRIKPWLKPGGGVLFFQTMFKDHSLFLDIVKPRLKYITTVDFGRVTYEGDFFELLRKKGITVTEDRLLKREWFNGEYHLIISAPKNGNGQPAVINAPYGESKNAS